MDAGALTISFFRPEDAEGVAKLFTEIYGDNYPAKIVYHPDQLIQAFKNLDNIPIVVRTPDDRIVGYSSLFRAAPNRGVYEKGNGAVAMDFRNAGVMGMIFKFVREMLPGLSDVEVLFGEPVCNHVYIQKAALANLPFRETAIEIDLMPSEAYKKENSASGRVSTLLMFITVAPKPHPVYLPGMYKEYLGHIYDGFDDARTFSPSTENLPQLRQTRLETRLYDFAKVARITVHEAGSDFETALFSEEEGILGRKIEVIQAALNLSWPWINEAVAILKNRGYFFGGLLPRWFGEDGLLMQKVLPQPNWDGVNLFSDRAKLILDFAKTDWQQ